MNLTVPFRRVCPSYSYGSCNPKWVSIDTVALREMGYQKQLAKLCCAEGTGFDASERDDLRTPDFMIIGAARCGTTALAHFLSQHPDVIFSVPKEPHFFALANQSLNFAGPGDDAMMNTRAITTVEKFSELFSSAKDNQLCGEGSVSTLYYPDRAIANIQQHAPDAKMIVVLRNPIDRAYSSFLYMTARGHEPEQDFEKALDDEERRIEQNWHHIWHYTKMGFYSWQLKAFFEAFGREQVRVIDFKDVNEQETFSDLLRFIGADDGFMPDTEEKVNRSGRPKNALIHAITVKMAVSPVLRNIVHTLIPMPIRHKLRQWNLKRPEMSAACRQRLAELYAREFVELKELVGIDFSETASNREQIGSVK